jgi:Cytochrome P450
MVQVFITCNISDSELYLYSLRTHLYSLGTTTTGTLADKVIGRYYVFIILNFLFRSLLHDREVFDNPQEFQPERYLKDGKLNPNVRDPDCAVFGFGLGRRSVVNTKYSRM